MAPVQLYVYDLSNGMAAQLSLQLTGRHIEGIWHTSIVIFGKETWFGQGIHHSRPGMSHMGRPLRIVDLGETGIDEQTWEDYINEMRHVYTADKYHLLDFNCNSFTNDCAGFLTGGSIPSYVKDLPQDFLSTPFGAALRPTIDSMYRRPVPGEPLQPQVNGGLANSVLQQVASRAATAPAGSSQQASLSSPVQVCSNPASFKSILSKHVAVTAFFTSQTCAPCKVVEPVFEELAASKASPEIAFIKVDLGISHQLGSEYNVHATPTFLFFLRGTKTHEIKGANAPELRTQVNLLIYDAFPPHRHGKLNLRNIRKLSLNPILFPQLPNLDALSTKLLSTIDALQLDPEEITRVKSVISDDILPFIRERFVAKNSTSSTLNMTKCLSASETIAGKATTGIFPLLDLWRLLLTDAKTAVQLAGIESPSIFLLLQTAVDLSTEKDSRNLTLTALRLASNFFSCDPLARTLLSNTPQKNGLIPRDILTALLVPSLLHENATVRVAASSLSFNVSVFLQKPLMEAWSHGKSGQLPIQIEHDDGDWEVEILSALVEALRREESGDVVHRLAASIALLVHLTPHQESIDSVLEVLQVKEILLLKIKAGAALKQDVKELLKEIANELC